ncbi:hypothetical protein CJU90_1159 [Yarrowia sp. C11]|nr:hypothetical protein CJU90_1159 [Yarrowia sp. C11]
MLVTTSCGKFQLELYDQDNQAAVLEFESLVDLNQFSEKPVSKSNKFLGVAVSKTSPPPVDSLKFTGAGIVAFLDKQLIISLAPIPDLTNASIFGRVSQGLAVVEALRDSPDPVIFSIEADSEGTY